MMGAEMLWPDAYADISFALAAHHRQAPFRHATAHRILVTPSD
jgi:hypothetical protein